MISIDRTYSTQDLAAKYGVSAQTVNRWIRKCCKAEGVELSAFGTKDVTDSRIRTFSESDVQVLEHYVPAGRNGGVIDGELADDDQDGAGQLVHQRKDALGLIDFSNLQPTTVNITFVDSSELREQAQDFRQLRGQGLINIGGVIKQNLSNLVDRTLAEQEHAVNGFAASAAQDVLTQASQKLNDEDNGSKSKSGKKSNR